MLSFNRRGFLLAAAALAGCGFQPVYNETGPGGILRRQVQVDAPNSADGYDLRQAVYARIGRPDVARYGLALSVDRSQQGLAVTASQVTVRYNVLGTLTYALRDLDSGQVMTSGEVTATTSYSASGTTVATQAAQDDANTRLMQVLTDRMLSQLVARLDARA